MTKEEYILYKYAAVDRDLALDYSLGYSEDPVIQDKDPIIQDDLRTNGRYNDRPDWFNNEMLRDDRSRLNDEIEKQQIRQQINARTRRNPLSWFINMFRKKQQQPQPQQQQVRPEDYTPLPADAWHLGGFGM